MSPAVSPLNGLTHEPDPLDVRPPSIAAASEQLLPLPATTEDRRSVEKIAPNDKKGSWKSRFGKTVSTVLSLFGLALLCSLLHYFLFAVLHGQIATGSLAPIRQSYVTATSFILATLFRAALLGSVGMCFAQQLWRLLRDKAIPVGAIESLFQMRYNPFELANARLIRLGPILFLIAVYMWLVPLAVTFPPGALIIAPIPFKSTENLRLPGLNPLSFNTTDLKTLLRPDQHLFQMYWTSSKWNSTVYSYHYGQAELPLISIARLATTTGEIIDTPQPRPGVNSSHVFKFIGPQLVCQETKVKKILDIGAHFQKLSIQPNSKDFRNSTILSVNQTRVMGALNCSDTGLGPIKYRRPAVEQSFMECREHHVSYTANFTFTNGVRSLNYQMSNIDPQPVYSESGDVDGNIYFGGFGLRADPLDYIAQPVVKDQITMAQERVQYWNSFAIFDSLRKLMTVSKNMTCSWAGGTAGFLDLDCTKLIDWTPDGSDVAVKLGKVGCSEPGGKGWNDGSEFLLNSVLNRYRYSRLDKLVNDTATMNNLSGLNITQASLNELLTNITISALTLGMWYETVPVNLTEYHNTYQFSQPLNLILPYSISLGVGLLIIIMGFFSLHRNEVSATDGGFLQVMMATKGDTRLEALVIKQGLVGPDKISKELKTLKIRYGELINKDEETQKKYGFGTVEETTSLRRRKIPAVKAMKP